MSGETKLHHVGIAVANIDDALKFYRDVLGMSPGEVARSDGARILHLHSPTGDLELLEPESDDTPIGKYLARRGPGIHHVCLQVPDLRKALRDAESSGYQLIDREPRSGALGRMVAFLHPKDTNGVLVELTEG